MAAESFERPCVCSSTSGKTFETADSRYRRCANCNSIIKLLTEQEYLSLDPGYDPGDFIATSSKDEIRRYLGVEDNKVFLRKLCDKLGIDPVGANFLDVGCGMGGNMLAAQELGMTATGFEPSNTHGKVANEALKLSVKNDYFSASKVGSEKFDLVLLSHVIEHIYDPVAFTRELVSVTKPKGGVAMVTPNAASLVASVSGKEWPMLVPLDHVTMLTPEAVPYLCPEGYRADLWTSEYRHEFMSTIGSILKARLKGRPTNYSDRSPKEAPNIMQEKSDRAKALHFALAAASLPFYFASSVLNKRAALTFVISR